MKNNDLYYALFGEEQKRESYKFESHSFEKDLRVGGKQYCRRCGTISLNNEFSDWAIEKGCLYHLHPAYEKMRKKTAPK